MQLSLWQFGHVTGSSYDLTEVATAQFVANLNVAVKSVGKLDAELRRELLHARVVMQKLRLRVPRHRPREPRDLLFFGSLQPFYRLVPVAQSTVNQC